MPRWTVGAIRVSAEQEQSVSSLSLSHAGVLIKWLVDDIGSANYGKLRLIHRIRRRWRTIALCNDQLRKFFFDLTMESLKLFLSCERFQNLRSYIENAARSPDGSTEQVLGREGLFRLACEWVRCGQHFVTSSCLLQQDRSGPAIKSKTWTYLWSIVPIQHFEACILSTSSLSPPTNPISVSHPTIRGCMISAFLSTRSHTASADFPLSFEYRR